MEFLDLQVKLDFQVGKVRQVLDFRDHEEIRVVMDAQA